jgi:hypothetical protein
MGTELLVHPHHHLLLHLHLHLLLLSMKGMCLFPLCLLSLQFSLRCVI